MTEVVNPYRLADAIIRALVARPAYAALFCESSSAMFFGVDALARHGHAAGAYARSSMHYGSMGHALAGSIGFCAVTGQRAIVFTGDGSLHLMNPLATAVKHGLRLALVVLNDGRLSLPYRGTGSIGACGAQSTTLLPEWDFTRQGSDLIGGRRVTDDDSIEAALDEALTHDGCFVVDALIDRDVVAPIGARIKSANAALGGGAR